MYTQLLHNLLQLKLTEILINVDLYECLCKNDHLNKKYTLYMKTNKTNSVIYSYHLLSIQFYRFL